MNSTLLALNTLALVALVAFHFHDASQPDAALAHVQVEHFMPRPAPQLADMNPNRGMPVLTSQPDEGEATPVHHIERFTF